MAFVDELVLQLKAGKGGDGVERWRHEKHKEFGGPAGGDGGKGGDVYLVGSRDLGLLYKYRHEKLFAAKNGGNGAAKNATGANGEDLFLKLPLGSVVADLATGKSLHILADGVSVLLLRGGDGGFGNTHFKSSTNQRPTKTTKGYPGEEGEFSIELQLVVEVGLIGYPNAGKSSLLNAITNAEAKVGAYQFTTIEPNLGALHGHILADIPGLIEGAAEGRGLGHKFLRHIKRTKMLAHLISLENEDVAEAYKTIRAELKAYDTELAKKDEIIILTKTDVADAQILKKAQKALLPFGRRIFLLSIYDDASLKEFSDELVKILRKKEKSPEN